MLLVLLEPSHSVTFRSLWRSFGTSPPCLILIKFSSFISFLDFISLFSLSLSSAASLSLCLSSASTFQKLQFFSLCFPISLESLCRSSSAFLSLGDFTWLKIEGLYGGEVRSFSLQQSGCYNTHLLSSSCCSLKQSIVFSFQDLEEICKTQIHIL